MPQGSVNSETMFFKGQNEVIFSLDFSWAQNMFTFLFVSWVKGEGGESYLSTDLPNSLLRIHSALLGFRFFCLLGNEW